MSAPAATTEVTEETVAPRKIGPVFLPKEVKIAALAGKGNGRTVREFTRPMTDAIRNYSEWRRQGFKGAWWWHYAKSGSGE